MLTAAFALVLGPALLHGAADPCAHTLDRTEACTAPANEPAPVASDAKPAPEAPARDPLAVQRQLTLAAAGAAALGGGALVWTQVQGGNAALSDGQRDALRIGGISCLAASGAIASASLALLVFDPSTGKMRITFESGD